MAVVLTLTVVAVTAAVDAAAVAAAAAAAAAATSAAGLSTQDSYGLKLDRAVVVIVVAAIG